MSTGNPNDKKFEEFLPLPASGLSRLAGLSKPAQPGTPSALKLSSAFRRVGMD
jgi:hypothetical protein